MNKRKNTPFKAMIVDDSPNMRLALKSHALKSKVPIVVVAEASDGLQAVQTADVHKPDLIIIDQNMPRMNGAAAAEKILLKLPDVRILGVSSATDSDSMLRMFDKGAHAFLAKPFTQETFDEKVEAATA